MSSDFEKPASVDREITVNGKTATYKFTEPFASELEQLFDLTGDDGQVERSKTKGLRFRVIAAVVSREDGSPISIEEAGKMKNSVVNALHKEAMAVMGLADDKAAEDAGNA